MNKNWKLEIIPNYSKVFQNMFKQRYNHYFIVHVLLLITLYIFMLTQHQILQTALRASAPAAQEKTDGAPLQTVPALPQWCPVLRRKNCPKAFHRLSAIYKPS